MEMKAVSSQELGRKFRSKHDLYNLLSIDCKSFDDIHLQYNIICLPTNIHQYNSWDQSYQVKRSKKIIWTLYRLLKKSKLIEVVVPRFNELKVENVWSLIREVEDINVYFPDLKEHQLPNREYMYSVLSTLRNEEVKNMICNARKNRSIDSKEKEEDLVYISNEIYEEINSVMAQKCKQNRIIKSYSIQGKSSAFAKKKGKAKHT